MRRGLALLHPGPCADQRPEWGVGVRAGRKLSYQTLLAGREGSSSLPALAGAPSTRPESCGVTGVTASERAGLPGP